MVGRESGLRVPAGTEPSFSIMCSAYRCEEYLADTIESVVAQTRPDWELVVVDNGMSDSIAAIVERYSADPRVRLIRQENRRLVGGIATAAAAARGRYLVPLDSDDMLMPEFCRRMAEVLDARPEIDALSCDALLFQDGEERDMARSFLRSVTGLDHSLTLADLIGAHDVAPYFAAFRREAWFAAGGYAPGTDLVEDIALFLRLVGDGYDVRVLPEKLTRYRMRDDSASRDPSSVEAFESSREQAYAEAARSAGDPEALRALDRRLRGFRYQQALRRARWSFLQGDVTAARHEAHQAFRAKPTLRSTAVVAGLSVSPRLLRAIHPVKQHLTTAGARLAAKVVGRRAHLTGR
ncbi:glycosyltransferase family 2 protein [Pseudonocardia kujensis]|uniref:glycosyltransferase family 2 protein n=1 Tax=Pseudonocardia kujensis TaxID=1128675 RepID=UPI001E659E51|nr:glycosyltransferase family A protein [Pseudonocardia kujensis]MCE0763122.1 glycosyltransferase family 2 protein [Pseudonocardia kujensis]